MTAAAVLAASTTIATAGTSSAVGPKAAESSQAAPYGSFAYSGAKADAFVLPDDMTKVDTQTFANGRTSTRYQQMVEGARVFGGQITVIRTASGDTDTVIGAYFPELEPKSDKRLTKGQARAKVARQIGRSGMFSTELRINPRTARLFYEVESIRRAHRPVRWIDAANGRTLKAFDAIAHGEGVGVKGDTKPVDSTFNEETGRYELVSADGRQATYDVQNKRLSPVLMTDDNDVWDLFQAYRSPSQPAGVDAHYYANVVDDFFQDTFDRNSIDDNGMRIRSYVHYGNRYCNAFWNGAYMTYGDGDGDECLPLSGGLDVDAHELTHGVTDYTSNLIYMNESGALNEGFSDMMGNTTEFYAEANGLDPAAEPDWLIGEDVIDLDGDPTRGFRNMADPAQDGDPDHVVDQYTGTGDNGGVHTNSGIPNHAYYLTVNGGQNAGCTASQFRPEPTHTEDCDVIVEALGLDRTAQVYYEAFTGLTEYANFCDARNATVASASSLYGKSAADSVSDGWAAVGVHGGCTEGTPPPPPCVGSADATIPFESPHPYGNNGDCTWTYDNGQAGFAFHFSMLETEAGYDYVYIKDANGNVLATYDGQVTKSPRGVTTPCIPTSTGSVQLVTDAAVVAPGFIVDAVERC